MMTRRIACVMPAILAGIWPGAPSAAGEALDTTGDCAAGATIYSEVPLHTGVANERVVAVQPIGSLKFPTGYEEAQYADCLRREGVTRDVKEDPYFARLEECRASARREVSVTEEAAPAAIGSATEAAVDACMRGVEPARASAAPARKDNRIEVDVDTP
jgi:hypothetical protein